MCLRMEPTARFEGKIEQSPVFGHAVTYYGPKTCFCVA